MLRQVPRPGRPTPPPGTQMKPKKWTPRRMAASVRDALDGALHPWRRRRARKLLGSVEPTGAIVFVCLGNVCRSPYAEYAFRDRFPRVGRSVTSAGFIGPGRQPPDPALEVARRRGVEHSEHRSRLLDRELMERAAVLLVFDTDNVRRLRRVPSSDGRVVIRLGDLDPVWPGKRPIWDPWGRPLEDFEEVFTRIDRCLDVVAAELRRG